MTLPTLSTTSTPLTTILPPDDRELAAARTIIIYGDSGLGKSTNARFFAQYQYEMTGLPVRLVSVEDSSKTIFESLIRAGIVEAKFLSKPTTPVEDIRALTRGDWDGKMIKPGEYSAYIFEGLTSMAELILAHFTEQGWFSREQKADQVKLTSGEFLQPASQSGYGKAQDEILNRLKQAGMLPVNRVLWTAHEAKGTEDGQIIRGPGLVGKAATSSSQKYCGLLLHFDSAVDPKTKQMVRRVYYERHPDNGNAGIFCPAKTTIPSENIAELQRTYAGGYFEPGVTYGTGLDKFLRLEESLLVKQTDSLAEWKKAVDEARRGKV